MAMLTLNGAALPDPSALSVELQDALLSARRTLSGAASVSRAEADAQLDSDFQHLEDLPAQPAPAPAVTPQPAGMDQELRRAAAICSQAKQAVVTMFGQARLGRAIDTAVAIA